VTIRFHRGERKIRIAVGGIVGSAPARHCESRFYRDEAIRSGKPAAGRKVRPGRSGNREKNEIGRWEHTIDFVCDERRKKQIV